MVLYKEYYENKNLKLKSYIQKRQSAKYCKGIYYENSNLLAKYHLKIIKQNGKARFYLDNK